MDNSNVLPAFTDLPQTRANFLPTTRKTQMIWLATLTAITLIGQYVMLGTTGLGRSLSTLPNEFFIAEKALWGLRALVEIAVVVYVGMTYTDDKRRQNALHWFEILLIALIVLTVGPVWISSTLNQSIVETIQKAGVYIWGSGLAGISATMLAAVAYAYKAQPVELGHVVVTLDEYEQMRNIVADSSVKVIQAQRNVSLMLAERDKAVIERDAIMKAHAIFSLLSGSALARVTTILNQGDVQSQSLAQAFGLTESTVRGVLAELRKDGVL